MKKNKILKQMICLVFTVQLMELSSCHPPPRTQRAVQTETNHNPLFHNPNSNPTPGNPDDFLDNEIPQTTPPEFSHCPWVVPQNSTYHLSSKHLGSEGAQGENNINLCQSQSNELAVTVQFKYPVGLVCFYPSTHSGNRQTYVGESQCGHFTDNKVYQITLKKNRSGFQGYPVTGIIIMKNQKYTYPPYNHQISSPALFEQCAREMAYFGQSQNCEVFKKGGHYYYHRFPSQE